LEGFDEVVSPIMDRLSADDTIRKTYCIICLVVSLLKRNISFNICIAPLLFACGVMLHVLTPVRFPSEVHRPSLLGP
jgi:hypothetical protein